MPASLTESLRQSPRRCRNQAIAQVCAFPSPFSVSMSETAILRQTDNSHTSLFALYSDTQFFAQGCATEWCLCGSSRKLLAVSVYLNDMAGFPFTVLKIN